MGSQKGPRKSRNDLSWTMTLPSMELGGVLTVILPRTEALMNSKGHTTSQREAPQV